MLSRTSLALLRAHGVLVSHLLRMREALGSIHSVYISITFGSDMCNCCPYVYVS